MSSIPVPSDLINQIQSTLRSKSQIHPSSNPSLPSLNDLIAAFDSNCDPSHLCCSNCLRRGGFVRGDHSTLCIFCGRDRGKDGITHSVSFNSTLACKNMLQYLQLDGSELVTFEIKANDSDKGQEMQQSHTVLSSLLDLELNWPSEKEETVNKNPIKDEVSVPAVLLSGDEVSVLPAVNLSEADFDNVFTDSMNRTIGASTAPIGIDGKSSSLKLYVNTESQEALRKNDTTLFDDSRNSNVAVSSSDIEGSQGGFDSFADWDASFQSANSGTSHSGSKPDDQNAFSKSVDLFEGSTASLAIPETSIKELVSSQGKINNTGSNEKSTDDWDIFGHNVVKNNPLVDSASDLKSANLTNENDSWGEGEIWATTASNTKSKCDDIDDNWVECEIWTTASKSKSQQDDIDDSDQSTDNWGNFSSVTSGNLVQNDAGINTTDHLQSTTNDSDIWGNNELLASLSNTKSQSDDNDGMGNNIGEIAPADDWGNFSSSGKTIENVLSNTGDDIHTTSKTNEKVSWYPDEIWATLSATKTKHDNDDETDNHGEPTDDWGDFFHGDFMLQNDSSHMGYIKPATNIGNDIENASKTNENDSLGQDEILVAISNTKSKNVDNEMVNHEETVDDWDNFSSIANMVQSVLWTNTVDAIKSTSETNEFDNMEYRISASALNPECNNDDSTSSHKEPVDDWGTFSSKNNMVQNDLWTNTADRSHGTSKTNENVSWSPDELWTTLPISKSKNDDNSDTDNFDESADDWGEFSFTTGMVQNEVSTNTADHSKTTMKTNENDSWSLDETWASLNTKSKHDANGNNGIFGDALDYWHDFAISNEASKEKISNKHAPSPLESVDQEDIEFGDFMHSDAKLGASDPNAMNDIQMNEDHNDTKNIINTSTEAWSFGNLSDMCSQTAKTASRTKSLNPQDIRFDSLLYTNSISRASSNPAPFNDMNGNDCATKSDDKDDSFDAWQDFTSSKETSATNTVNAHQSDFDSFIYTNSVSKEDVSTGSKDVNDDLLDAFVFNHSKEFKSTNNLNDNTGLFEPWKEFMSLNEVPAQAKSDFKLEERLSGIKSVNSDDMEFGDFLQSSSTEITPQKSDNHDDNFDDWQDFVCSNNVAENSANMFSQPDNMFMLHEHVSETKSMDL